MPPGYIAYDVPNSPPLTRGNEHYDDDNYHLPDQYWFWQSLADGPSARAAWRGLHAKTDLLMRVTPLGCTSSRPLGLYSSVYPLQWRSNSFMSNWDCANFPAAVLSFFVWLCRTSCKVAFFIQRCRFFLNLSLEGRKCAGRRRQS